MSMLVGMANWAMQFGVLVGGLKLGQLQSLTMILLIGDFLVRLPFAVNKLLKMSFMKLWFDQLYENKFLYHMKY